MWHVNDIVNIRRTEVSPLLVH